MIEILLIVLSYLVGSVPFGLIIGKIAGVDVRNEGSGNIGATNVGRLLGKKFGVATLVCDVGKALLLMIAAGVILKEEPHRELVVLCCGGAAFLGHLFPVYLKFQGGKGVATALGIFLYLAPLAALLDMAIFIAVVYNWGYVSLGSITAALMMPGLVWLITGSFSQTALAVFVGILIWLKHSDNIKRLMNHEEKSWKKKDEQG